MQKFQPISLWLLRVGVAVPFLYAGADSLFHPENWLGYIPAWGVVLVERVASMDMFLRIYAIAEIILGVWLLSGKKMVWSGIAAAAWLLAITVLNIGQLPVVFRDLGLAGAALSLSLFQNGKARTSGES